MDKYKIAVSVGHNPSNPGFVYNNYSEYSEMVILAAFLVCNLQELGHKAYLIGSRPLDQKVTQVNNIPGGADCAIELHLNAGNGVGYETLFCPGSTNGETLACHVHKAVGTVLGSRDRGIKPGWFRMDLPGRIDYAGDIEGDESVDYFLRATNCPAIITELYFLDNEAERSRFVGNHNLYKKAAERIAVGIILYLSGLDCG